MYLEDGKCAHCGKILHDSQKYAPHNVEYNSYAIHKYRPYFCSPDHVQSALDSCFSEDAELQNLNTKWDSATTVYERLIEGSEQEYKNTCKRLDADHDAFIKRIARLTDDYSGSFYGAEREQISAHETSTRDKKDQAYRSHLNSTDRIRATYFADLEKVGKPRATLREKTIQDAKLKLFSVYHTSREAYEADQPPLPTITDHHRFEHTQILGPSGSGKTTLIQDLALDILERKDEPAIIIIDPKGFMVDRISRLRTFYPGVDIGDLGRLIIIDATKSPAPPLNLFSQTGTPAAINYAINNFDYLFAQAGVELTDRMRPIFRHCARLMFSIPHADISLFKELLESKPDDPRFQAYIAKLTDEGARRFFSKDFYGESYKKTRESVKERFDQITSLDTRVQAAFSSPSPPLDFGKILADGKIVLVNADFTDIGVAESKFIGRHIINQVLGAAFSRGRGGRPAFLFIDEFQDFVDEQSTPKQFRLAREYNLGIICAHQQMFCPELSDTLRSTLSSTTIKYVSKLGGKDRGYMLNDLDCTEDFLNRQVPDHDKKLVRFGVFVKGQPPSSIAIRYPNITPEMQMADRFHKVVLEYNNLCLHPDIPPFPEPQPKPSASPPTAKDNDSDSATDWPAE